MQRNQLLLFNLKVFLICFIGLGLVACALMGSPLEFPDADGAGLPDDKVGILDYAWVGKFVTVEIDGTDASYELYLCG